MMVILEVVRQETRKGEEQKLGMVQHTRLWKRLLFQFIDAPVFGIFIVTRSISKQKISLRNKENAALCRRQILLLYISGRPS